MAIKWIRWVALVATVVAFVSHMPADAGDSCRVTGGVVRCAGGCDETFRASSPPLVMPFKLVMESTLCQPLWKDVQRVLPGLMVVECPGGHSCTLYGGKELNSCPCVLSVPLVDMKSGLPSERQDPWLGSGQTTTPKDSSSGSAANPDDLNEVTILVSTLSSLAAFGLVKAIYWLIKKLIAAVVARFCTTNDVARKIQRWQLRKAAHRLAKMEEGIEMECRRPGDRVLIDWEQKVECSPERDIFGRDLGRRDHHVFEDVNVISGPRYESTPHRMVDMMTAPGPIPSTFHPAVAGGRLFRGSASAGSVMPAAKKMTEHKPTLHAVSEQFEDVDLTRAKRKGEDSSVHESMVTAKTIFSTGTSGMDGDRKK